MCVAEGQEFRLEDKETWEGLLLGRGEILEVHLPSSSLTCREDLWAGFWIKQSAMLENGDWALLVGSLGCSDPEIGKYLSSQFNRRQGRLHLCPSRPCATGADFALHATRVRIFTLDGFDRPYLTTHMRRQIQKWEAEEPDEDDEEALDGVPLEEPGEEGPEPAHDVEKRDPRPKSKGAGELKKPAPRLAEPGKDPGRGKINAEEKARLRARLEEARAQMVAGRKTVPDPKDKEEEASREDHSSDSSRVDYSPSPCPPLEQGGGELCPRLEDAQEGLQDVKDKKRKRKKEGQEEKSRRKRRRSSGSRSPQRKRKKELALEVLRDGTTSTLQNQLVVRAADTARQKQNKAKEERKKHRRQSTGHQLAKILTKFANGGKTPRKGKGSGGHKKSSKKEAKRRRRKKRREGGDPDGSPGGSSSEMSSYDTDSQASWEGESSCSEDKKMEAPLRRKAKERPGSVLELLIQHARSQLDQSSKVGIAGKEEVTVTSGVKLTSYFAIIVKPQMSSALAQARECHHLANAMDLLRQGDLDLLGDTLAGRFMALHQSVLDGSWSTARHLELFPMQEGSAAGPEVILNAKRHAKLALKLSPNEGWGWGGAGKGKGNRGRGAAWPENSGDGKGKTKKGGKSKNKNKGWGSQGKEGEQRTQEKIPEK